MSTVTIVGSLQHQDEITRAAEQERTRGHRVHHPTPSLIDRVTAAGFHLEWIAEADEVLVVNPRGHIDAATATEIAYALLLGKPVRYTSAAPVGAL